MSNLEYWTKLGMGIIKKDGINMPNAIKKIIVMKDFKQSGVSENELLNSMSKVLSDERQQILDQMKKIAEKLKGK